LVAVLFVYVLARGLYLATALTDVRKSSETLDFKSMQPLQLKDNNFDVMFGFFKRGKFLFLPSKYGRFEAFQYLGRGEKTKQTYSIEKCNKSSHFVEADRHIVDDYLAQSVACVDTDDIDMSGDDFITTDSYSALRISFVPCIGDSKASVACASVSEARKYFADKQFILWTTHSSIKSDFTKLGPQTRIYHSIKK
jgi:hypothetical protein